MNLQVQAPVSGNEQIHVVKLQLAGKRVDGLGRVLIDILAIRIDPGLFVNTRDRLLALCLSHRRSFALFCDAKRAVFRIGSPGIVMLDGEPKRETALAVRCVVRG